jgi:hypothetical protein
MNWLKRLFANPTSTKSTSANLPPLPDQTGPAVAHAKPAIPKQDRDTDCRVSAVIVDVLGLEKRVKMLGSDVWPGSPQWNQVLSLQSQAIDRARSLTHADLSRIEPFLRSADADTRRTAAYIIKVVHLDSPSGSIPAETVTRLAALLRDANEPVRDTALDSLREISKSAAVDAAAADLISLGRNDKKHGMAVIEILGTYRQPHASVVEALKRFSSDDSADVASAARQVLERLGIGRKGTDKRADVQKLVWTWKSSGAGRFEEDEARAALKGFSDPLIVCEVLGATLLAGDWIARNSVGYAEHGRWPNEFCWLLGDIGDPRYLDRLVELYRAFDTHPEWWGSGDIALAILRIAGGEERARTEFAGPEFELFISRALTGSGPTGVDNIDMPSFSVRLSEQEKRGAISRILQDSKINEYTSRRARARVGLS